MKNINKYLWLIGGVIGALAGYIYWKEVGCLSGTCLITSKPLNSMAYFGVMGGLLLNMLRKEKKEDTNNNV
jgi:hypothetical protein